MAFSRGTRLTDEMSNRIIAVATELVEAEGAEHLSVKRILQKMNISNRVFYNRFQNVEDILKMVYESAVIDMHALIEAEHDKSTDYCEHITAIASAAAERTFLLKNRFKNFAFRHDELSQTDRKWWLSRISEILEYGIEHGYLIPFKTKDLAYAIWCFCRGFSAEGVVTNQSMEEFDALFKAGFSYLIAGVKNNKTAQTV